MPDVSLVATVVGTLLGFALGAVWYGPLFGRAWMASVGLTDETIRRNTNPATTYGTTFVLGLVGCYVLGLFLGPNPGLAFSVAAGAAAGICWVATSLATNELFEGRSVRLMLINGGYHAVRFTLFGLAFGLLG
jgi:MFS family permease